jgi:hypothetical protein
MIVTKQPNGYTLNRKYIYGKGFVDTLQSIGSYVARNKDLIAKPLLGAVGNLAATGLEEGGKALLVHLMNKKKKSPQLDDKGKEILQSIINSSTNTSDSTSSIPNIIGSGIKKF